MTNFFRLKILSVLTILTCLANFAIAEDGYKLWLRYSPIENQELINKYQDKVSNICLEESSATLFIIKNELQTGLSSMLGTLPTFVNNLKGNGLIIGTPENSKIIKSSIDKEKLTTIGDEGYLILSKKVKNKDVILVAANTDIGCLYGTFELLKLIQTNQPLENLNISSSPKVKVRILNHWDNLDRTVERGYAGFSIWDWHKLPDYIDPRYIDYARANASIGINGAALTNVNSNALVLTPMWLEKVKALADVFRPYGIKVYLTARFSAPIEIGELETADPLDENVQKWWKDKAKEIYSYIPDFGGFLVKANSEGQPGPQNYNRTHVDGANTLADAVKPFGGIVMWRAFVYSNEEPVDRAKQAYNEFVPYDGDFRDNVLIQVKNGPIDFQPREPFHPMFGAMPKTPLMMEFQITQEYLGQATQLVYLAPMYKECLESDTYANGKGSTVAKVVDGSLDNHKLSGMAGVSNIGNDRNWTGHTFGQANWYSFGRLAWDNALTSEEIADEWIRMTFGNDDEVVKSISQIMNASWEASVNYMTPLGLHHIMGPGHHYGPGPWVKDMPRADWTSVYYHKADEKGIGFDRTSTGSHALEQYRKPVADSLSSLETCPDKLLLWFHHLDWDYKMKSGNTLWDELCYSYYNGVSSVDKMKKTWNNLNDKIDEERFKRVNMLLTIQQKEAKWWKESCLLYFQSFSNRPIPESLPKPQKSLDYYQNLNFPYAPGIRPRW